MLSFLFVSTIIYVVHVSVILSHDPFKNVAYSKTVVLSSRYHPSLCPGAKAVNGLLSDLVHTADEKSPWLRIDLGATFLCLLDPTVLVSNGNVLQCFRHFEFGGVNYVSI